MPSTIRSVALSTGVTLPYVEHGDPDGVPLVLLHGYSDSWRSWELLLSELPHSVHAFAVTQRGHGDADKPPAGYGPHDLAADVAAFLDAVGVEAAAVVGHSGGSYTAQQFAIDNPERTLGMALVGAFRSFEDNPVIDELWSAVSALTDPVDPDFVREFQQSTATQPVPAAFLDAIIADSCKLPARVWHTALRGLLDADPPTTTGAITVPTLILWGDRDELAPRREQNALAAAIDDTRTIIYAGTGHAPHWEQPHRVAADLAALCASLASPTPSPPMPSAV